MDVLQNYKDATANFEVARKRWRDFMDRVAQSTGWLRGADNPGHFKTAATLDGGPLRADAWPCADQMIAEIDRVQAAQAALVAAYEAIPDSTRDMVKAPDGRIGRDLDRRG